jgi:integrase
MLATCDDSLEGQRDRALLCFGFASGGRRRSEVAAADLRDLRRIGPQGFIYRLEHSKTQQAGVTASSTPDKPILDRAAQALEAWLAAAGISEGAIFGGCGNTVSALPCHRPPWARLCSGEQN